MYWVLLALASGSDDCDTYFIDKWEEQEQSNAEKEQELAIRLVECDASDNDEYNCSNPLQGTEFWVPEEWKVTRVVFVSIIHIYLKNFNQFRN